MISVLYELRFPKTAPLSLLPMTDLKQLFPEVNIESL